MPPTLHFSLVMSTPFEDCGLGGITCTGGGGMTAYVEDFTDFGTTYRMRIFRSTDNGLTWAEPWSYTSPANPWFYQMKSPRFGRVLVGSEGPYECIPEMLNDIFPVSDDAGETWVGANAPHYADDCLDDWTTRDFVVLDANEVLAYGGHRIGGGVYYHMMRSLDGGATWGAPFQVAPAGTTGLAEISTMTWLGGDTLVASGRMRNASAVPIYRSTDRGATWTGSVPPAGTGSRYMGSASLGGGVVLIGNANGLFRSTDSGVTWASISASLPSFLGGTGYIVSPGAGVAVVMIGGAEFDNVWWWTADSGVTWARATHTAPTDEPRAPGGTQHFMAVADDGSILSTSLSKAATATPGEGYRFRIWRGVWSEVEGLALAGPCVGFVLPEPPEPEPEPGPPEEPLAALQQQGRFRQSLRVTGTYRP